MNRSQKLLENNRKLTVSRKPTRKNEAVSPDKIMVNEQWTAAEIESQIADVWEWEFPDEPFPEGQALDSLVFRVSDDLIERIRATVDSFMEEDLVSSIQEAMSR